MSTIDPIGQLNKIEIDLRYAIKNSTLVDDKQRFKKVMSGDEQVALLELRDLVKKIQTLSGSITSESRIEDIDILKVKILYLEKASCDIQLMLKAMKISEVPERFDKLTKEKIELEEARKEVGQALRQVLMESRNQEIVDQTRLERELADDIDLPTWALLEKNLPLLEQGTPLPSLNEFRRKIENLKKNQKAQKLKLVENQTRKNQLKIEAGKDQELTTIRNEIEKVDQERKSLRQTELKLMLKRGLELAPYVKNGRGLFERIEDLQRKYNRIFEYTDFDYQTVSFDPFSEKQLLTPEELDFRKQCAVKGYNALSGRRFKAIMGGEALPVKGPIDQFIEWGYKHPAQAQFMVEGISLLVAAEGDEVLTKKFSGLIAYLEKACHNASLPEPITKSTLRFLELSDFFRNVWMMASRGNENGRSFLRDYGLESLRSEMRWDIASHPKPFAANLALLRSEMSPLIKNQVKRGIEASEDYQELAHKEFISDAFNKAEEAKKTGKYPKIKYSVRFNWSQAKEWTKNIVNGQNWFEKGTRLGALAASTVLGGTVLGSGIAVTILTAGAGGWIGAVLVGVSAGVFSFSYATLNKTIDKLLTPKTDINEKKLRNYLLQSNYIEKMKMKGVLPNYGKTAKLKTGQKKQRKLLQDQILKELAIDPECETPLEIINKFRRYVQKNFPDDGAFGKGEGDRDVCLAAINYLMDHQLRKAINKSVEVHYPLWKNVGALKGTDSYKKRLYKKMKLL